ncbi:TetR/AcrR family transcriptional regulator [Marinivivus vitaminiproducens]|uniref:TetR/AcrR family transcriptional regulator n=1 Tax=Marinivivus vitaminiproducens TaxID=3035935 RepID=UPI003F9F286A
MARRPRSEMISETRAKLIAAGRHAFATRGYADAAAEDLTAEAGLTRGALYHHFGGKPGLLEAVIAQIDMEISERLRAVVEKAGTPWDGFVEECIAWIELALDPEIRRIVLLDGPAVLGDPARWPSHGACLAGTMTSIETLIGQGTLKDVDPEATAHLVNGAALNVSLWIASAEDPQAASEQAIPAFRELLLGLRKDDVT